MAGCRALGPLLAAVALGLSACSSGSSQTDGARVESMEDAPTGLLSDTSARGRVDFGCALQRGMVRSNATVRHYGSLASRALFTAALEEDHDDAVAARLWNANDALFPHDSAAARRDLLRICAEAGGAAAAEKVGMSELRSYMCVMSGVLAEERPTISSYGAASTAREPGDPRRTDVEFVSTSQFLLVREDDERWLDVDNLAIALDAGDEEHYSSSLEQMRSLCADGSSGP